MLVIFSGGSGVGKNTVIEHLIQGGGYALMPTYTTREKRPNESEGNPYCFLSEQEFKQKIDEGEFYEYEQVHLHYYGTSKKLLKKSLALGKTLLKDIDVLGTQNLLKKVGSELKIVAVFLKVDSPEILRERLKGRGESDIELRLNRYQMEQQYAVDYDYVINNEELNKTLQIVSDLIAFESAYELPVFTKPVAEIDLNKAELLASALKKGEKLAPVQVALNDGHMYLIDGHHRYLASLMAGERIAKEIVSVLPCEGTDAAAWQTLAEGVRART